MRFLVLLLLAGVASTSLAAPSLEVQNEDESNAQSRNPDIDAQLALTNQPSKEHVSSEELSKVPLVITEELISKENVVIESTKPKSKKVQQPHSTFLDKLKSAAAPPEESAALTPQTATTSEGKLIEFIQAVRKDLGKVIEKAENMIKAIIARAEDIVKP